MTMLSCTTMASRAFRGLISSSTSVTKLPPWHLLRTRASPSRYCCRAVSSLICSEALSQLSRRYTRVAAGLALVPGLRMSDVVSAISSNFSSSASTGSATTPDDVLQFWFKDINPQNNIYKRNVWFNGCPEFDKEFGECLKLASTGALDGWMSTVQGRLALVIVLDQLPRNLYRNSPRSFAQDEKSLKIALETINQGLDKGLAPWERWFLYLPLMHSENSEMHGIADRVYRELAEENSNNKILYEVLLGALEFERKHAAVLKRFGRYPSRNAILGRPNTKEEEEFLSHSNGW